MGLMSRGLAASPQTESVRRFLVFEIILRLVSMTSVLRNDWR